MDPEIKIEQQSSGRWAIVRETPYGDRRVLEEHDTVEDAQTSGRLKQIR